MSILQKTIQPPLVPSLNRFSYPNKLPGSHKEGLSFIGSFWKCKYELHILGFSCNSEKSNSNIRQINLFLALLIPNKYEIKCLTIPLKYHGRNMLGVI